MGFDDSILDKDERLLIKVDEHSRLLISIGRLRAELEEKDNSDRTPEQNRILEELLSAMIAYSDLLILAIEEGLY